MAKKDYVILESGESRQYGVLIKGKTISLSDKDAAGLLEKKPPIIRIKTTNDELTNDKPINKTSKAKGQGGVANVNK